MSRVFFDELKIPEPDYNLNAGSGSHAAQTAKILVATEEVLIKESPGLVIVFGDTNSTLAGSLAASKLHIPVAHVEAGLRSFDRTMPEEINRVLTDHMSNLLFTPTKRAVQNLRKEGLVRGVYDTGDVMVDSLESARAAMRKSAILDNLGLVEKRYAIMTVHRASNTDSIDNLRRILDAVSHFDGTIVFPVHPRTRKAMQDGGLDKKTAPNIRIVPPIGYVESLRLMAGAAIVITDSGGMQKEAYLLGTRCITLRENTEWPETLAGGWNELVGVDPSRIRGALDLKRAAGQRKMPFGEPGASGRMAAVIESFGSAGM